MNDFVSINDIVTLLPMNGYEAKDTYTNAN